MSCKHRSHRVDGGAGRPLAAKVTASSPDNRNPIGPKTGLRCGRASPRDFELTLSSGAARGGDLAIQCLLRHRLNLRRYPPRSRSCRRTTPNLHRRRAEVGCQWSSARLSPLETLRLPSRRPALSRQPALVSPQKYAAPPSPQTLASTTAPSYAGMASIWEEGLQCRWAACQQSLGSVCG
jgi:hypothetical protein